jgi:hypothetical protein
MANSQGRVSAVAADPTTPGRLFVGAASGGVWMTTDGGNTFKPIFDTQPSLAIGAIALDSRTNPPTIFVATGEGNGSDSYYGQGIFKSADLGANWTQLAPGILTAWRSPGCNRLEQPSHLFAGDRRQQPNRTDSFFLRPTCGPICGNMVPVFEQRYLWLWNDRHARAADDVVIDPATPISLCRDRHGQRVSFFRRRQHLAGDISASFHPIKWDARLK